MSAPGSVNAFGFRQQQVPNGSSWGCGLCHFVPGGPRTQFGVHIEETLDGRNVDWSAIYDLDSDGDGYTNGEELGDAFGVWRIGDNNPTLLSAPHETFETPAPEGNAPVAEDATLSMDEDDTLEGTLGAEDEDGDTLRFRIVDAPQQGAVTINDRTTGAFTYTPVPNFFGQDTFTFQVWDGNNLSVQAGTVVVDVAPINDPPEIFSDGDQTVDENQQVVVEASGQDVEDGVLLVTVDPLPDGAVWDEEDQALVWTPNYFQAGEYPMVFSVTDNDGATSEATVTITVNNVNRRPEADEVEGPDTGDEGATYRYSIDANDPDLEPLVYTWSFGNGDSAETDVGEVDYAWPQQGSYVLRVVISDGDLAVTRTFNVEIANVAPEISAGDDRTIGEGDLITFLGTLVDPGQDDQHSIAWNFGDGGTSDELQPEYAYGDDGVFTATLVLDDGDDTAIDSATITVLNLPPVVEAGDDVTLDEGARYLFEGTYSDPGFDDELTVVWDFGDGVQDAEGVHTYVDQGTYAVVLSVSDDDGETTTDGLTVTVVNVDPSFVNQPPLFAPRGETYVYEIETFDPGDDTVEIEFQQGPPGMVLEDGALRYTPDPDEEEVETYTVSLRIYDEDGGEATQTYTLTVGLPDRDNDGAPDECEDAYDELDGDNPDDGDLDFDSDGITNAEECIEGTSPIESNAPTAPSISQPLDGDVITFQGPELVINNSADPDDDPLTYTIGLYADRGLNNLLEEFVDVPETPNRTRVTVTTLLTENSAYYWRARAYDGRGYSPYSETARFVFSQVNDPPSVPEPIAPQGTVTETPVFEAIQAEDPEGQVVSYDFQVFFDLPDNQELHSGTISVFGGNGPRVMWTSPEPFEENVRYRWRIRAVDRNSGRSDWSEYIPFFYNAVNEVPPAPTVVSPEDGVTLEGPGDLVFIAQEGGEDADLDVLTYSFRIASEQGFAAESIVYGEDEVSARPGGEVTWNLTGVDVGLTENQIYYWDVRAYDGTDYSPAVGASFLYSSVNEAPQAPGVISPAQGESYTTATPEFAWTNVVDPEGHVVTYTMEVHANRQMTDLVLQLIEIPGAEGAQTALTVQPLENNNTYYWRVRGVDELGMAGPWSDTTEFSIAMGGQAPTQPVIVSPTGGEAFPFGQEIELVWMNATDAEGDPITYTVEILNDADQLITSAEVEQGASGGQTSLTLAVTLSAGDYNWRVRAEAAGQLSPYSDSGLFTVTAAAPSGGGGDGCAVSAGHAGGVGTSAWALLVVLLLWRRSQA